MRRGLSEAQQQSWDFWDQPAARMVDAQASGLASRVRRMASARASGDAWAERVLEEAALLQLLLEAHGRLDELPEATREDVRQLIGWAVPTERVLERPWVRDDWAVVGQVTVEDDRLRSQRTWLRGAGGADALILAFAPARRRARARRSCRARASTRRSPSTPARCRCGRSLAEHHGEPHPLPRLPGHATVGRALAARAEALARNPWIDRWPVAIEGALPARDGDGWAIADVEGGALAVRGTPWELLAVSGGHPVDVFGELEGDRLRPLSVAADGRVVALA